MSLNEKEKKLAKYIENEFQNIQLDPSRILNFLEHKKVEVFDSKEFILGQDIDFEISTYFSEPVAFLEYNLLGKMNEEDGLSMITKTYGVIKDPDIDAKTILERKLRYHKEMVKFLKSIHQTRARKLIDLLHEARNSCLSEYTSITVAINHKYYLGNYNLFPMLIPLSDIRNIEDLYFSIYLINDFIDHERKIIEIDEVTPTVLDDSDNDESESKFLNFFKQIL